MFPGYRPYRETVAIQAPAPAHWPVTVASFAIIAGRVTLTDR